jgi:hypothetical protein
LALAGFYDNMASVDPEDKKTLANVLELAKSNNRMLSKMRRAQRRAAFLHTLYWLVIIGAAVGGFYYIQPYLQKVSSTFASISNTSGNVSDFFKSMGAPQNQNTPR